MRSPTTILAAGGTLAAAHSGWNYHAPWKIGPATIDTPNTSGFDEVTVHLTKGGNAVCVSGSVPVMAATKNLKLNFDIPKNQTGTTETFLEMITPGSGFMDNIMGGMQSINSSYDIHSTLCMPVGETPNGVQLLTHGIGFDGSYWDFALGYSYVDVAAEHGYASFFYDRLGTGKSEKPDAINIAQSPLEVEIANNLATMLRKGEFGGHSFNKIVGAGHSYGSIVTQAVTAMYPSTFDAAILTGFSVNMSALSTFTAGLNLAIASQNQPLRFGDLSPGYLVSDTSISNQIGFFRAPNFDPEILSLSEATKGPVTYGQLFTQGAVTAPAKNYTNPLAVVNGNNDLPFCFGNCSSPHNLANAVKPALYPNLAKSQFGSYLAPTTGHGLNLHYSANDAYDYIQNFLEEHGLGM